MIINVNNWVIEMVSRITELCCDVP
jgi:hypothetical protein